MAIYIVSAISLLLGGMLFNANKRRKSYLLIAFVWLTILFGLRDFSVGADTITYCNRYIIAAQNDIHQIFSQDRFEVGFLLMCKILNYISSDPRTLLLVSGVIINGAICRFVYKYSTDVSLSMYLWVLLCFGSSLNLLRGYIAFAIVLFSFEFFSNNKKIICLLCIVLAMSFHTVAIVAILPIGLYRIFRKLDLRRAFLYVVLISASAMIFFPQLLNLIFLILPQYSHYTSSLWGQENYFGTLIDVLPIISVLALGLMYSFNKDEKNLINEEILRFLFWQMACALVFSMLAMRMTIFNRVTAMFYPYIIFWIPMILRKISNKNDRKIWWFLVVLLALSIFVTVSVFRPEWNGSVPYKFFWNE